MACDNSFPAQMTDWLGLGVLAVVALVALPLVLVLLWRVMRDIK